MRHARGGWGVCKELCDSEDGPQSCQDCGAQICFDTKHGDDIFRPAYVTASGDLYCDRCGGEMDRAEERDDEYYESLDALCDDDDS